MVKSHFLHDRSDAIWKLYEALFIDPKKHEALWCMGSALTSLAIMTPNDHIAKDNFDSVYTYFQKATADASFSLTIDFFFLIRLMYNRLLIGCSRIQAIESHEQAMSSGASKSSYAKVRVVSSPPQSREGKNVILLADERIYVQLSVVLAVTIVGCVRFAKANVHPPQ
ncbi:unnamed protein product [Lactuca saligna]|uniref:Uncharacterized protein n=1 Tax=Lactuca saligna TaxID=75948 RepID=A0AA35Y931_LACSI|nr:unnamed protein product [Lactuca saligna]